MSRFVLPEGMVPEFFRFLAVQLDTADDMALLHLGVMPILARAAIAVGDEVPVEVAILADPLIQDTLRQWADEIEADNATG